MIEHILESGGKVVFDRNQQCFFLHNHKHPAQTPVRFWPKDMKKLVRLLRSAQHRARFAEEECRDAFNKYQDCMEEGIIISDPR
jgi:hypothetical protein